MNVQKKKCLPNCSKRIEGFKNISAECHYQAFYCNFCHHCFIPLLPNPPFLLPDVLNHKRVTDILNDNRVSTKSQKGSLLPKEWLKRVNVYLCMPVVLRTQVLLIHIHEWKDQLNSSNMGNISLFLLYTFENRWLFHYFMLYLNFSLVTHL